jgi:murein peptide amidase A
VSDAEKLLLNPLPGSPEPKRLGRNRDGYLGETIDITAVLSDCAAAARAHGWLVEEMPVTGQLRQYGLSRKARRASPDALCLYLSTGIHGDEPAGPLAVRRLLEEDDWPLNLSLRLCPCLNPQGFLLNQRLNGEGLDLNRQYLRPQARETVAHIAWLERQPPFDLCLCLHEDWESHGFYVYELNPDQQPSLAEAMVARVAAVCPIDRSEMIEGRAARNGIIRPSLDPRTRPEWPEAFFLLVHKTRLSYTLEAPSDFPLATRVAALVTAVRAALDKFQKQSA